MNIWLEFFVLVSYPTSTHNIINVETIVNISVGGGCNYGDIRLAHFYSGSFGRSEGRVEVCYNNEWGTVCSDYWDDSDATVACRQLGYDGYIEHWKYAAFGYGKGNVWLRYLQCSGQESSLFSCSNSLGYQSCNHYKDVTVRCYSKSILQNYTICVHVCAI